MPGLISSAEPRELFRYSDAAVQIDRELVAESYRLARALERFQATCREGAFRVPIPDLDGALRRYANEAENVDHWVRQVGIGFQRADEAQRVAANLVLDFWQFTKDQIRAADPLALAKDLFALRLVFFGLKPGTTYVGQVIFADPLVKIVAHLPGPIKDIIGTPRSIRGSLGLSSHLTHCKWLTLPGHITKQYFVVAAAIEVVKFPFTVAKDIDEYWEAGWAHVSGAIFVDFFATGWRVGIGTLAVYALTSLAAVVVGALSAPPVICAAVIIIVGVAASVAANWFANWVVDKVREPAIEAFAAGVERTAEAAKELAAKAEETGKEIGEQVVEAGKEAGERVATLARDAAEAADRATEAATEAATELGNHVRQKAKQFEGTLKDLLDKAGVLGRRERPIQPKDLGESSHEGEVEPTPTPEPRPLSDSVKPGDYSSTDGCVLYAQKRRPDLGAAGGGAANYIDIYKDSIQRVTEEDTDLRDKIAVGWAVVWPRKVLRKSPPGWKHGHVAIVEEVGLDYVIVSHAGWPSTRTKFSRAYLESLYLIP